MLLWTPRAAVVLPMNVPAWFVLTSTPTESRLYKNGTEIPVPSTLLSLLRSL